MEDQLRSYLIKEGEMDGWVGEWKAIIYPLRKRLGFDVVGAWVVADENRFVWILGYSGPQSFAEADRAYYRSPERGSADPDPARHLAKTETKMMSSVLE